MRIGSTQREAPTSPAIGEALVARGLLSAAELQSALEIQKRTGSRLGTILVASDMVRRDELYQVLGECWGLDFVDLTTTAIDRELLAALEPRRLLKEGWVPLERHFDGTVLVAVADAPNAELQASLQDIFGRPVSFAATTDWDIATTVMREFRGALLEDSAMGLWRQDPALSAKDVATPAQIAALACGAAAATVGFAIAPRTTGAAIMGVVSLYFLANILFKLALSLRGRRLGGAVAQEVTLSDDELPLYTVLVPCYREANVVEDLINNLASLDYPADKLDVLLLLEEDDVETRAAATAARPPGNFTFVTLPAGAPQTKPKACNVGLTFARGEFLVIYDAEDRPEPDQLRRAISVFRSNGDDLICVQAGLNYFNARQNVLTRLFALEYTFWFDLMLHGLEAWRLPIPLGGSSNHFRTEGLRRLGGWDPFNVTEDADLGIRASSLGYRVGVISSTTYEEANSAYYNFIRQRSRWLKGYLQTTLVHTRHPLRLIGRVGLRPALSFGLLIGGTPLAALALPLLYLVTILSLLPQHLIPLQLPAWELDMGNFNMVIGNAAMIALSILASRRREPALWPYALLCPLYWLLHSVAAYKGLFQLITRPHYWEKTLHGLPGSGERGQSSGAEGGQAVAIPAA